MPKFIMSLNSLMFISKNFLPFVQCRTLIEGMNKEWLKFVALMTVVLLNKVFLVKILKMLIIELTGSIKFFRLPSFIKYFSFKLFYYA